jgi:hypothetical protein
MGIDHISQTNPPKEEFRKALYLYNALALSPLQVYALNRRPAYTFPERTRRWGRVSGYPTNYYRYKLQDVGLSVPAAQLTESQVDTQTGSQQQESRKIRLRHMKNPSRNREKRKNNYRIFTGLRTLVVLSLEKRAGCWVFSN